MMSDSRRRPVSSTVSSNKSCNQRACSPRQRTSASAKVSEEAPIKPKPDPHTNQNKLSLPSNLRYEFENALLGLCDVWFEEIKPNLIRNNVKIRVHEPAGEGDHRCVPLAECSHLEPGSDSDQRQLQDARYANCSLKPHKALRERYLKQRAPQSQPTPLPLKNPKPECKRTRELTARKSSYREPIKPTALLELFTKSNKKPSKHTMSESMNNSALCSPQRRSPGRNRVYSPSSQVPSNSERTTSPKITPQMIYEHAPVKASVSPERTTEKYPGCHSNIQKSSGLRTVGIKLSSPGRQPLRRKSAGTCRLPETLNITRGINSPHHNRVYSPNPPLPTYSKLCSSKIIAPKIETKNKDSTRRKASASPVRNIQPECCGGTVRKSCEIYSKSIELTCRERPPTRRKSAGSYRTYKMLGSPQRGSLRRNKVYSPSLLIPPELCPSPKITSPTICQHAMIKTNDTAPKGINIKSGHFGGSIQKSEGVRFISAEVTDHDAPTPKSSGSERSQKDDGNKSKELTMLYENDNYAKTSSNNDLQSSNEYRKMTTSACHGSDDDFKTTFVSR